MPDISIVPPQHPAAISPMIRSARQALQNFLNDFSVEWMKLARFVQAGFWITACAGLIITYFGIGGIWGIAGVAAFGVPFSIAALHGLRCRNCGVSYYFDPTDWNITGVNLLVPVAAQCRKCGASR